MHMIILALVHAADEEEALFKKRYERIHNEERRIIAPKGPQKYQYK